MTGTHTHNVAGIDVITTVTVYPSTIDITITVDLSKADVDLPDHSPHQLINYMWEYLAGYRTAQTYWWSKLHRKLTVRTGSQARRVIKHALAKIDDAVCQAKIDRSARAEHLTVALS